MKKTEYDYRFYAGVYKEVQEIKDKVDNIVDILKEMENMEYITTFNQTGQQISTKLKEYMLVRLYNQKETTNWHGGVACMVPVSENMRTSLMCQYGSATVNNGSIEGWADFEYKGNNLMLVDFHCDALERRNSSINVIDSASENWIVEVYTL